MIRINLLPVNLRKKERSTRKMAILFPIIFSIILVISALHIIFALLAFDKKMQLGSLGQTWDRMQTHFKEVDVLKRNLTIKRDKVKVMKSLFKRDVYLTDFLNQINQAIPQGLWLSRLSFSYSRLVIEGSVFSFGSEEVSLVNNFFNELKNDDFSLQNFNNFNLDSVQRRNIKQYEILDFLLTAGINKERFEIGINNNRKR